MTSTADCKKFIVDFVTANPSIILSIYGKYLPELDSKALIADATTPKFWKRVRKFKIDGDSEYCVNDKFHIHNINVPVRRQGYDGTTVADCSLFTVGREFCLRPDEYENAIQFIILEKHDGTLVFGPYSGD